MDEGSSPLTRGKLVGTRHVGPSTGLIPAHAGKTSYRRVGLRSFRAHPRSRGENVVSATLPVGSPGSSPLTRGKRTIERWMRERTRLIPAHAGKTRLLRVSARPGWAHPRSRGENAATHSEPGISGGSSPLTRGKRRGAGPVRLGARLIPAHAGKTVWRCTK